MTTAPSFLEVCPTIEDLSSQMKKNVECPVDGCEKTFKHDNALRMHVIKTHKIFEDERDNAFFHKFKAKNPPCSYHCPISGCKYQKGSAKSFRTYGMLKQHFKIVHMDKKYVCEHCGFKFSIESALKRHVTTCGIVYKCGTCGCPYTTREALLTHCKRKEHVVPVSYTRTKHTMPASFEANESRQHIPVQEVSANCLSNASASLLQCQAGPEGIESLNSDIPGIRTSCVQSSISVECANSTTSRPQYAQLLPRQKNVDSIWSDKMTDRHISVIDTKPNTAISRKQISSNYSRSDNLRNLTPFETKQNQNDSSLPSLGIALRDTKTKKVTAKQNSAPSVVNLFYVFNVNNGAGSASTVKSIIDQTSQQPVNGSRPVCILPKPAPSCSLGARNHLLESDGELLNNGSGTKTSSVVQTFPIDRTSAETQTTGDYVLMKAMQSANIPIQKESRGAQVSPRTKIRGLKRTIPTQSTSVQTGTESQPVVRRKRRKKVSKGVEIATASTSSFSQATSPRFTVSDLLDLGFSDNETQTIAMIEELEASLAASISTQTRESFLANPVTGQGTLQQPLPMQTIETQTLTVDTGCDATEGFSLLSFLNSTETETETDTRTCGTETPMNSFDEQIGLGNPMIPQADIPLGLPTPESSPMMDALNHGSSLFDASAQTTDVSNAIQTQTIDTMFSQLLSNMETQTSDDLPLLELGFMDNQTQTPFDLDLIGAQANVETQTSLHVSVQSSNANVQSIDTETQTLFPNLSSTDSHTQTSLADLEKLLNL